MITLITQGDRLDRCLLHLWYGEPDPARKARLWKALSASGRRCQRRHRRSFNLRIPGTYHLGPSGRVQVVDLYNLPEPCRL